MDKNERKRLKREGRKLVEENSQRIAAEIAARMAENPEPLYSPEWMRWELQRSREEAAQAQAARELAQSGLFPSKILGDRAVQIATRLDHAPEEGRQLLAGEFSHISEDPTAPEFVAAFTRAIAILDEAEVVAEAVRDRRITELQAEALLQERFPGHERRIYREALAEGLSRTR